MANKEQPGYRAPLSAFRIEDFLVLPTLNRIERDGEVHQIEPRVMQVLVHLAARPREVISRQELFDLVWADSVVCEEALTRTISDLRRVFRDDTRTPRVIETIRKGGYRLIAPIVPVRESAPGPPPPVLSIVPLPAPPVDLTPPSMEAAESDIALASPLAPPAVPSMEAVALTHDAAAPPVEVAGPSVALNRPSIAPEKPLVAPEGSSLEAPQPPTAAPRTAAGTAAATAPRLVAFTLALAGLCGLALWGSKVFRQAPSVPILSEPRPLTSFPGLELFPALSPDGSMVAFCWAGEKPQPGRLDLYVMSTREGAPVRLTDLPGVAAFPAWSPDGTEIAFSADEDGTRRICTVPVLGGSVRRLARMGAAAGGMSWSADGQTIAYAAQDSTGPTTKIRLLSVATLARKDLSAPPPAVQGDTQPALSPDGRNVAFVRINGLNQRDAYVAAVETGMARKLNLGGMRVSGIAWLSPKSLIASAATQLDYALWQVPLDGGAPVRLCNPAGWMQRVSAALNGGRLVYEKLTYARDIWCCDLDRAGAVHGRPEPLIASTQKDYEPVISPDGRSIAFVSDRSGFPELWVAEVDGRNPRRITDQQAKQITHPRWSPDGTEIAYTCETNKAASICVVPLDSRIPRRLTSGSAQLLSAWSRRGNCLYYQNDSGRGWEIRRVQPDGNGEVRVTDAGDLLLGDGPGGRGLVYTYADQPGIWLLPDDGGVKSLLVSGDLCRNWAEVVPAEQGLYFLRRGPERSTLGLYNYASTRVDSLASLPWYAASLSLSPDRTMLVYDSIGKLEDDLMLVDITK